MFEEKTVFDVKRELDAGDPGGLSDREAKQRLSIYGKNELQEKKPPSVLKRLIGQFMDPLIYVLLAAGVISVLLGEQGDAAIIAAVVLLNAAVGVAQEGKAQKALDSLKKMTRLTAVVRRDGRILEVDSAVLVPGDLVLLSAGQQVPADLRLITAENLKTQESALTGESVPVEKDAGFLAGAHTPLGDRKNMAYMSTFVTAGSGEGIVTATGMETEIGGIAKLIHETPGGDHPAAEAVRRPRNDVKHPGGGTLRCFIFDGDLPEAGCGGDVPDGDLPGGGGGPGRTSGGRHDRSRTLSLQDGKSKHDRTEAAVGGDAWSCQCGLLG